MWRITSTCLALVALSVPVTPRVHAQAKATQADGLTLPLRMIAFAVNMSNIGSGGTANVEIRVTQWSSAAERKRVIDTMVDKGQDALLKLLSGLPSKGRLRFPDIQGADPSNWRIGWDLRYAWHTPDKDGGNRIVVALDRYMSFLELRESPRTVDYPFTLIQINLDKNGEGKGVMAWATSINFDKKKNTVELENFSSEPVRFPTIKVEKG